MPFKNKIVLKFLAIIGLMVNVPAAAQFNCQIIATDTLVCYNYADTLYTGFSDTLNYYWHHSGETTPNVFVQVKDTTTYYLTVTSTSGAFTCTDSITIYTYPFRIYVDFEQVNKGCPEECKSQVSALVSGGYPPYRPVWNAVVAPNDSNLALGLCSDETYNFRVYDTVCIFDTSYKVDSYHLPEIELLFSPDTLYLTNPKAEFSFENKSADSIGLTNWTWIFPDSTSSNSEIATYVFQDTATMVTFAYTTQDGCNDTLTLSVPLQEFEMEIPNVFTPNGDGANEKWEIPDLRKYISNEIVIFDRWGKKVFEATNYYNNWDGGRLGDGVYFYILRCFGYWKEDVYKGSVTIIGSNY